MQFGWFGKVVFNKFEFGERVLVDGLGGLDFVKVDFGARL